MSPQGRGAAESSPGEPARKPRRFRLFSRAALKRLGMLAALLAAAFVSVWWLMIRMPGSGHTGPLPAVTEAQTRLAARLREDVTTLASTIGQRSTYYPKAFAQTALWLKQRLAAPGYEVIDHSFVQRGSPAPNLQATLRGSSEPGKIIVVGAHYDTFQGTPGADDNASGVAGVLALARDMAARPLKRTVRFVLFVNEEPPAFQTSDMGSWVYAKACKAAGDDIAAMISLESIGYYSDTPGSQRLPAGLGAVYSNRGDFIAFVGHVRHRGLLRRCIGTFRRTTPFPSEGAALFDGIPGVGWSDHWAFWQEGFPALMVTDTAEFRNPDYHSSGDRPEKLDYERMARVIEGVRRVVEDLADGPGL